MHVLGMANSFAELRYKSIRENGVGVGGGSVRGRDGKGGKSGRGI